MPSGDHTYEHLTEDITLVSIGYDELDGFAVPPTRQLLADLVNHGRFYLVVDLTALDYLSSTGLGVLVSVLKRTRAHDGGLALVLQKRTVLKIFRVTGLINAFSIFDTVDRAVEHLGRSVSRTHV
ncbi:STAS domain-containing protein [Streptomyces sp. NPDC056480]|uniref:STAS domain-containing protein n=1 Tax=Streptomyces sp. NPDC056480 TaxID=3345833 RepID=UPI0036AD94C1